MSDHKENARKVHAAVKPVLNALHSRENVPVSDINAAVFGVITGSMQADIGQDQARNFIESAMNNVWGKPKKSLWQRLFS